LASSTPAAPAKTKSSKPPATARLPPTLLLVCRLLPATGLCTHHRVVSPRTYLRTPRRAWDLAVAAAALVAALARRREPAQRTHDAAVGQAGLRAVGADPARLAEREARAPVCVAAQLHAPRSAPHQTRQAVCVAAQLHAPRSAPHQTRQAEQCGPGSARSRAARRRARWSRCTPCTSPRS